MAREKFPSFSISSGEDPSQPHVFGRTGGVISEIARQRENSETIWAKAYKQGWEDAMKAAQEGRLGETPPEPKMPDFSLSEKSVDQIMEGWPHIEEQR